MDGHTIGLASIGHVWIDPVTTGHTSTGLVWIDRTTIVHATTGLVSIDRTTTARVSTDPITMGATTSGRDTIAPAWIRHAARPDPGAMEAAAQCDPAEKAGCIQHRNDRPVVGIAVEIAAAAVITVAGTAASTSVSPQAHRTGPLLVRNTSQPCEPDGLIATGFGAHCHCRCGGRRYSMTTGSESFHGRGRA